MKSLKYSVIILALGMLGSSVAQAQDQSKSRGEGRRGRSGDAQAEGRGQMMNPEARVEQLDRALQLTSDQKSKIKEVYAKAQEEMRNAMRGGGRDQQANREKMQEMMRSTRDQVRALLTDEQKTKFDELPQSRGTDQKGRGKADRGGKKK